MKILKLKFRNINSLLGNWAIDFTKPEFTDPGLFVITGKTGAGKSSILDAITLALYGRTPRVTITLESNNVMTYGTNDCYSEIMFEIENKKWISSWKQERTRTGSLRAVKRHIADTTGKIYADNITDCNTKIKEILGLEFEQFIKVVMLAQGSFAAFLEKDNNKKGDLLEQITGTEIYCEISKKVFNRNKIENEKLKDINKELENIKTISEDELDILKREIVQFENDKMIIDNDLQIIDNAKKYLTDIENLQKQFIESKQKLPELEIKFEIENKKVEISKTNLDALKAKNKEVEEIIVKVRELDTKIDEKKKMLSAVEQTITELLNYKNEFKKKIENQTEKLNDSKSELLQKQEWVAKNNRYETLTTQYAVIENQNTQVCNLFSEYNNKKRDFENANNDLISKREIFQKTIINFSEKEKNLIYKEQELKTKKEELSGILDGKEVINLLNEREQIKRIGNMINDLIRIDDEFCKTKKEIENITNYIKSAKEKEKELSQNIDDNKKYCENLKTQIHLLDENIKFAQTIKDLNEHRKSLQEGKPCPLCGALEHPYALGNVPKLYEKENELNNLKKRELELNNTIQNIEIDLTKLRTNRENAQKNIEKAEKYLSEKDIERNEKLKLEISDSVKHIFLDTDQKNRKVYLEKSCEEKRIEYKQIDDIINKATKIENLVKALRDNEIPHLQYEMQVADREKTTAETNQKLKEQELKNLKHRFEETEKNYTIQKTELLNLFDSYGVTNIETLKNYSNKWNNIKNEIETLKEKINAIESDIILIKSNIENYQKQLDAKTSEKQIFETKKQELYENRFALFADKNVVEEEKRLKEKFEKSEIEYENAIKSYNYAYTELEKNKAIISKIEKELNEKVAENLTDKTKEELQLEFFDKKQQIDTFVQKILEKKIIINSNEENVQKNRKKTEEKILQEQISTKWELLNDLIGSHDGAKYRNFAQNLTFDHLIGLANIQLKKMSERYVLKRAEDPAKQYELLVIDKFQNCEERTAKNLSGGENFIVSLTLALGLANMASKNMKIDTMFIDEGFGTLDNEYLDTAITTLSNLQSDGKLIGVISHLNELKERITTHIEVIPKGNGHSQIEMRC